MPTAFAVSYGLKSFNFTWGAAPSATRYQLLEDPDGPGPAPEAQAGGDLDAPAASLGVPLYARLNATYRVRACNDAGCSALAPALSVDPSRAIGYIKSHNAESIDVFGYSPVLSADGNTLVVGAPQEGASAQGAFLAPPVDDNGALSSGAVYVFGRELGQWRQRAYLKASNSVAGMRFGSGLALSEDGSTLVVGAEWESTVANRSGALYVFTRGSGWSWSEQAVFKASDAAASQALGSALALSADGNVLAAGAAASRVSGQNRAGAVYVFARTGSAWSERDKVVTTAAISNRRFGASVALSGDATTLAVGASGDASAATTVNGDETDVTATGAGAGFVFTRVGGAWSQQAYLKGSKLGPGDALGLSIALARDGNTLALGARYDSRASTSAALGSAPSAGAVYVFVRAASAWSEDAYLKGANTETTDEFGAALALSADGATLAVGASGEKSVAIGLGGDSSDNSLQYAGAAYVLRRGTGGWTQQAYVKASNTVTQAGFGETIGLSADGGTLAVGGYDNSLGVGVGADPSNTEAQFYGVVYLY
ncbi:MAG TPA: integrin [Ramlibacter sp.]|nr:integrin [Ramlibacter sp.]